MAQRCQSMNCAGGEGRANHRSARDRLVSRTMLRTYARKTCPRPVRDLPDGRFRLRPARSRHFDEGSPRGACQSLAMVDPLGRLRRTAFQPADANHAGQRRATGRPVDVPDRRRQQVRSDADRRGRHPVRDRRPQPRVGDRRPHGSSDLALPARAAAGTESVLRHGQPGVCHPSRSPVHGDARRAFRRARGQDREGDLRHRDGHRPGWLRRHRRTAHRQRQSDCRHCRRRVREPRFPRCLRSGDRTAPLALLYDSGAGRKGQRDVARRCMAAGRRSHMVDWHVRSGGQPPVLGHGQSQSRLGWPEPARRQPLHRFAARARSRYRHAEMALPVHAARHARLGCERSPGPRRPADWRARRGKS